MNRRIEDNMAFVSRQMELYAGAPASTATSIDLDKCWGPVFKGLVIYPLAYVYATELPGNSWYQNPVLLDAVERAGQRFFQEVADPDADIDARRTVRPAMKAFSLVRDRLADPQQWKRELSHLLANSSLPRLQERERLTCLSSANCGFGTNHLAVELAGLTAYIATFRGDDDFDSMNPGGPELVAFAEAYLDRFMAYMDEGGYWPEADGPANIYSALTATSLFSAATDLNVVDRYQDKMEKAALFHTRFLFPNLLSAGVTDGRNRQTNATNLLSFCGLLPEGKALLSILAEKRRDQREIASGEDLTRIVSEMAMEPYFTEEDAELLWERASLDYVIGNDFAVLKRDTWMASVSNFVFRPRPEGHYNFDYQNLFSLYQKQFGVIFKGNNGKNDPLLSTFNKAFMTFDGSPLKEPMWKYVPGKGTLDISTHGFSLWRDYRGFEGHVQLEILDSDNARLRLSANARYAEYPVTCSLQPAAGLGRSFRDAQGNEIAITEAPFTLTGRDIGGEMILSPESEPHCLSRELGSPMKLSIPDNAEVVWPYKSWNPYNLETGRYTNPEDWTLLLKVPVFPEGAEILIQRI